MALTSTLYRFRIDLSDIDRGIYESLDFRVPMHPSESVPFLITRVLAFSLNSQEGLEFSAGLNEPDEPCIRISDPGGGMRLWIDIGNPSNKRIHKAAKSSPSVKIYTYKNPTLLIKEMLSEKIYQKDRIEIFSFSENILSALGSSLEKDNSWNIVRNDGSLMVSFKDDSVQGDLIQHPLS